LRDRGIRRPKRTQAQAFACSAATASIFRHQHLNAKLFCFDVDGGQGYDDVGRSSVNNNRIKQSNSRPARDLTDGACFSLFFLPGWRDPASSYRYLDEHGANSSIAIAPFYSPLRIRENSCDFPFGTVPKRDFRCHPSCDNPCAVYRRLAFVRETLAVQGRR
jgi:hypothetical protein